MKELFKNGYDTEKVALIILSMFFSLSELPQGPIKSNVALAEKIRQQVNKNINTQISSESIASIFRVSSSYANRVFKAAFGLTIKQYINEEALKKAAHLLRNSGFSVGEISDMLGYCNDNYFSGQFKKYFGMSPKQYQMKYMQKGKCNTPILTDKN